MQLTADNARQVSHDVRLNSIIDIYNKALSTAIALGKRIASPTLKDLADVVLNADEHDALLLEAAAWFQEEPRNFGVIIHKGCFLYSIASAHKSGGACLYFDLTW